MLMFDIPFGTTDWNDVEPTEHPGETGKAFWRTRTFTGDGAGGRLRGGAEAGHELPSGRRHHGASQPNEGGDHAVHRGLTAPAVTP